MSDFTLVDPRGWEYDLHSVYSAYIGYFQLHNIAWYERSWGHLFSSFEEFLVFSWPVITVTDAWTGKPHIVTRLTSIGAFLKMIKTRYGETITQAPNILLVTPFETSNRHLRHISDYPTYKKLHSTLPAVVLSALKTRVKAGEPKAIRSLWKDRDRTWLAIDFEWSERNENSCLEWGYAAVRCGHLDAQQHWPPDPDTNYRKGHLIISEYVDKVFNKHCPTHPWHYAFGDSQLIPKAKLPEIIQAVISSLASPDSEMTPNTLVLVAHGISGDLTRLEEMKIKLPHNMLIVDTATFERVLHSSGHRGIMIDPRTNNTRVPGSTLSLENMLRSLASNPPSPTSPKPPSPTSHSPTNGNPVSRLPITLPNVRMHNAGNDAFMCLFALQMLLDPLNTKVPSIKKTFVGRPGISSGAAPVPVAAPVMMSRPTSIIPGPVMLPRPHSMMLFGSTSPMIPSSPTSPYDLAAEFGQMKAGNGSYPWTGTGGNGNSPGRDGSGLGSRGKRMPGRGNANGNGNGNKLNVSVNAR